MTIVSNGVSTALDGVPLWPGGVSEDIWNLPSVCKQLPSRKPQWGSTGFAPLASPSLTWIFNVPLASVRREQT